MAIEIVRTADIAALVALGKAAGLTDTEGDLEGIQAAWAARDEGELVGAVMLRHHDGLDLVSWLAVRADHRGTGLGRSLVAALEEEAARRGVAELWATARAVGFFLRCGYGVVSSGPVRDLLIGPCLACEQYRRSCTPQAVVKALAIPEGQA